MLVRLPTHTALTLDDIALFMKKREQHKQRTTTDRDSKPAVNALKGLGSVKRKVTSPLTALQEIAQAVASTSNLDEALACIVRRVRLALRADVCSVYLSDEKAAVHLLMATEGLRKEAIGRARLRYREGLVGLVAERAEVINVRNAPQHPNYKLIPQTGEKPFQSFLGVPLTHQGEVLGVLVVQRATARRFRESQVSFLITLSAQLAGAIALARAKGSLGKLRKSAREQFFKGVAGAPGIAMGQGVASYHSIEISSVPDRKVSDPDAEQALFLSAISRVAEELRKMSQGYKGVLSEEDRALFEAYTLIVQSDAIVEATLERIRAGNWAPGALRQTILERTKEFESMEDPYLRERANDIRDIGRRIMSCLKETESRKVAEFPAKTILIGENLSPIELAKMPADKLVAVVSGHGSKTSHLSILARALGIPAVVGVAENLAVHLLDGHKLIVDGYRGRVYADPSKSIRSEFSRLVREERQLTKDLKRLRDEPAVTLDGIRITLYSSAGLLADLTKSLEVGAEGIGLYRTELPFMIRDRFPTEEEQLKIYREVLKAFSAYPVILRTLDAGGDKALPYFNIDEPNPFLGWRGIRMALDHPEILVTQLRAMIGASEGLDNLHLLFPMISGVEEIEHAIEMVKRVHNTLIDEGKNVKMPKCGVMIEVPSAVYQADNLIRRVDFLSIGTNDLTQFLLAVDRNNEHVAKLVDPLHPAVLHALSHVVEVARLHGKPISICGEAAADPAVSILLVGMGVRRLSVNASDIPRIKWVIRNYTQSHAKELLRRALRYDKPEPIREMLRRSLVDAGLGGLTRPGK